MDFMAVLVFFMMLAINKAGFVASTIATIKCGHWLPLFCHAVPHLLHRLI